MLPFLKKPHGHVGLIIKTRQPDAGAENVKEDKGLEACASDMLRAIQANDPKSFAVAIKNAFDIMESEPHEEGEHSNEDAAMAPMEGMGE
jgi:hypothetical protein